MSTASNNFSGVLAGVTWCAPNYDLGDCDHIYNVTSCPNGAFPEEFCTTESLFTCSQVTFQDTTAADMTEREYGWSNAPNGICTGGCGAPGNCPSPYSCVGDLCLPEGLATCVEDTQCPEGNFCALFRGRSMGMCAPKNPQTYTTPFSGITYTPTWNGPAPVSPSPSSPQAPPQTSPSGCPAGCESCPIIDNFQICMPYNP